MSTRKALVESFIARYKKAGKKAKGRLLDGFIESTGFNRCYARRVLRDADMGNYVVLGLVKIIASEEDSQRG